MTKSLLSVFNSAITSVAFFFCDSQESDQGIVARVKTLKSYSLLSTGASKGFPIHLVSFSTAGRSRLYILSPVSSYLESIASRMFLLASTLVHTGEVFPYNSATVNCYPDFSYKGSRHGLPSDTLIEVIGREFSVLLNTR